MRETKKMTAIIVEDNYLVAESLTEYLSSIDVSVTHFETYDVAKPIENTDIYLLDYNAGRISGHTWLRAHPEVMESKVVLMSGTNDWDRHSYRLPILTKPFRFKDLENILRGRQ